MTFLILITITNYQFNLVIRGERERAVSNTAVGVSGARTTNSLIGTSAEDIGPGARTCRIATSIPDIVVCR
jgi:hypothetical protein